MVEFPNLQFSLKIYNEQLQTSAFLKHFFKLIQPNALFKTFQKLLAARLA